MAANDTGTWTEGDMAPLYPQQVIFCHKKLAREARQKDSEFEDSVGCTAGFKEAWQHSELNAT